MAHPRSEGSCRALIRPTSAVWVIDEAKVVFWGLCTVCATPSRVNDDEEE
jgi:hypothetical protein